MAVLLGALSAACIGLTDVPGRRITARSSAITAAASLHIVAVPAGLATVFIVSSRHAWGDFGLGGLSGLGIGAGLACYYTSV